MPPDAAAVSVIIPAYRAVATIGRALDSIAAQTVKPAEVIVVDDGSDDGTYEAAMAKSGLFGDLDFKVIKQNNAGAGAARNRALKEATQKYVAFLDADDEWLPEKLHRSLRIMAESHCRLVSHNYTMIKNGQEQDIDCHRSYHRHADPFISYFLRGYIATSTVVADRKLLIEAGGFDPSLRSGQDFELWLAVISLPRLGYTVFDENLTRYYVTDRSITSMVRLRRRSALVILRRYAFRLKNRRGLAFVWSGFRALIIHAQATQAYVSKKQYGKALIECFLAPFSLLSALYALTETEYKRPDFLQTLPGND